MCDGLNFGNRYFSNTQNIIPHRWEVSGDIQRTLSAYFTPSLTGINFRFESLIRSA